MASKQTWCTRCVGEIRNRMKYGKTKSGFQRYICKLCKKTRVENYAYQACKPDIDKGIIQLTKEGLGIRSTARLSVLFARFPTVKLTTFLEFLSRA